MASPQLEDGFFRLANEIAEAIYKTDLSACELRLLLALFRKTYGFNKKDDAISLSQWQEMLGLPRQTICRVLKHLEASNIVLVSREGYVTVYSFQKDYERWKLPETSHAQVTTADMTSHAGVTESSHPGVTESSHAQVTYKRHEIQERHDAPALFAGASPQPLSRSNDLPPAGLQGPLLFPKGAGNHADRIREIERHGWIIRGADLLKATAAFVGASELPIPNATTSRKGWLKDIREHLEDFGLAVLERAYPLAVQQMLADGLTVSRPGSLTKTLPAIVKTMRTKPPPRPFTTESIYDDDAAQGDTS